MGQVKLPPTKVGEKILLRVHRDEMGAITEGGRKALPPEIPCLQSIVVKENP
jgi:hypothetical protein